MFKGLFVAFCLRVAQAIQCLWVVLVEMSGVDPGDPVDRAHFSRG
jgi:hypothetical protein